LAFLVALVALRVVVLAAAHFSLCHFYASGVIFTQIAGSM
jgi:hypothetical protein